MTELRKEALQDGGKKVSDYALHISTSMSCVRTLTNA
jgi:hypothetical protein